MDLVEAQTDLLGHPDERHPPDHVAGVAALAAVGPLGVDEALGLVEAQGGGCHPGALGQRADREGRVHIATLLDLK